LVAGFNLFVIAMPMLSKPALLTSWHKSAGLNCRYAGEGRDGFSALDGISAAAFGKRGRGGKENAGLVKRTGPAQGRLPTPTN
jgi:hypothetical protein